MSGQVAADLRAAAEVLRRDGWGRDVWHGGSGCHCAGGALQIATGVAFPDPDRLSGWSVDYKALDEDSRYRAAVEALLRHIDAEDVPGWNDEDSRTADEVIAALEAAADAAEAKS